jgi:lactate dehydrogenase-like 2-hydroxyacid dehydrogenase
MSNEVFVASRMTPEFCEELSKRFTAHFSNGAAPALDEAQCARITALVTNGIRGAEKALLDRFPNLQIIASLGIGVDAIDFETARARQLVVTNTPNVVADDVTDLAMGMLLDRLRHLVDGDRFVRAGKWSNGPYPLARSLTGKRLGIVGLGAIGSALARRAEAFKLQVKWYGPRPKPEQPYEYVRDLEELARQSDVLVVACSGGSATRHLIDARILSALGPQGVLVNVARGSVVDIQALISALLSGELGAAALDVLERQPQVPPELLSLPNVLLTPHLGTNTRETRATMGAMVIANLVAHFEGRPPPNLVIKEPRP